MGLFSGGSFASSNSGSGSRVSKGGGSRDRGKSPISDTSYIGKHGKPMTDKQIRAAVAKGELSKGRANQMLAANARAARDAKRAARADADDRRN